MITEEEMIPLSAFASVIFHKLIISIILRYLYTVQEHTRGGSQGNRFDGGTRDGSEDTHYEFVDMETINYE